MNVLARNNPFRAPLEKKEKFYFGASRFYRSVFLFVLQPFQHQIFPVTEIN